MDNTQMQYPTNFPQVQKHHLEILIKWIYEVIYLQNQIADHNNFELKTIELTVEYIKIYLIQYSIHPDYLQLLGVAALLIAIKFNECQSRIVLNIEECVALCSNQFQAEEVLQMETCLLTTLKFNAHQETISDHFDDLEKVRDLIMFVTLESDFINDKKVVLAKGIRTMQNLEQTNTSQIDLKVNQIIQKIQNKLQEICEPSTPIPLIRKRLRRTGTRKQSSQTSY